VKYKSCTVYRRGTPGQVQSRAHTAHHRAASYLQHAPPAPKTRTRAVHTSARGKDRFAAAAAVIRAHAICWRYIYTYGSYLDNIIYVARKVVLDDRNPDNTMTRTCWSRARGIFKERERDGDIRRAACIQHNIPRYKMILLLLLLRMLVFGPDPCLQIKSAGANQFRGWGYE